MTCANVFVLKNRAAVNGLKFFLVLFPGRWDIKELVHALSCGFIELWMHLGSLESSQEAGVA